MELTLSGHEHKDLPPIPLLVLSAQPDLSRAHLNPHSISGIVFGVTVLSAQTLEHSRQAVDAHGSQSAASEGGDEVKDLGSTLHILYFQGSQRPPPQCAHYG
jgi:hypothetical protein